MVSNLEALGSKSVVDKYGRTVSRIQGLTLDDIAKEVLIVTASVPTREIP